MFGKRYRPKPVEASIIVVPGVGLRLELPPGEETGNTAGLALAIFQHLQSADAAEVAGWLTAFMGRMKDDLSQTHKHLVEQFETLKHFDPGEGSAN